MNSEISPVHYLIKKFVFNPVECKQSTALTLVMKVRHFRKVFKISSKLCIKVEIIFNFRLHRRPIQLVVLVPVGL